MARITLGNRLETLTMSPFLSQRDKDFAASLLAHYQRRKSLTSGRHVWVDRLEAKAAETEKQLATVAIDTPLVARIDAILADADKLPWGKDILDSMKAQVNLGKSLSDRQLALIAKLEKTVSDVKSFVFTDVERAQLKVLVDYYATTGYYHDLVREYRGNPEMIPNPALWSKLMGSKYAKVVLDEAFGTFKFNVGQIVRLNSASEVVDKANLRKVIKRALGNEQYSEKRHDNNLQGIVIATLPGKIKNASRGAKQYQVLFFGMAETVMVEERWLVRVSKKKLRGGK